MPLSHARALLDIAACRTRGMGAQAYCCDDCGRIEFVPHSCHNRACPSCHAQQTAAWVAARRSELLPVRHHHLVFTLPAELRELARRQQRVLLAALMTAAAEAVQALAEDGRFFGGRIAVLAVLHTHTRALVWHPHVHLLVPGLAVADDREVRRAHGSFLVPVRALSPIFRARFAAAATAFRPGPAARKVPHRPAPPAADLRGLRLAEAVLRRTPAPASHVPAPTHPGGPDMTASTPRHATLPPRHPDFRLPPAPPARDRLADPISAPPDGGFPRHPHRRRLLFAVPASMVSADGATGHR